MRGGALRVAAPAAAVVLLLLGGASAAADPPGRALHVPAGLTASATSPHFEVHYDPATPSPEPGMTIEAFAQQGAADFEEAYGRQVAGGGLSPNAGLRAPIPDDDGTTDVYIARPIEYPQASGGFVYRDLAPWKSAYVFMTPNLSRRAFRFRAGHELVHVVQNAYLPGMGDGLFEAFANWGAEWALPDIHPTDSNFYGEEHPSAPHPWLPLDCSHGDWKGTPCGNGYWQWMFVQAQVEDFGPGFVSGYYERFAETLDGDPIDLLEHQIGVRSGGAQSLRGRFAVYARDVWDPTRWTTESIRVLHNDLSRRPASYLRTRGTARGEAEQTTVDHLAARYVLVLNDSSARAGDVLELSWTRPAGMEAPVVPLVNLKGQEAWGEGAARHGTTGTAMVPFGPDVDEVVLPLVNDSLTADDQPFSYRLALVRGPDRTAPKTSILRRPRKRTRSRVARFVFGVDEDARFQCKLDRRGFRRCGRRARFRVGRGRHRIAVRAIDLAGNTDPTPAKFAWRVVGRR